MSLNEEYMVRQMLHVVVLSKQIQPNNKYFE